MVPGYPLWLLPVVNPLPLREEGVVIVGRVEVLTREHAARLVTLSLPLSLPLTLPLTLTLTLTLTLYESMLRG